MSLGFAFCPKCGTAVPEASIEAVEQAPEDALTTLFDLPAAPAPGPVTQAASLRGEDESRTRNRRALVASFVVMALVLAVAGVWSWSYIADRPATSALDETQALLAEPSSALGEVNNLDELHSVAASFEDTISRLEAARASLENGTDDLTAAAHAVVDSRLSLAVAVAALAGVTTDDFSVWGEARGQLVDSVASLDASNSRLAGVDPDRAGALSVPAGTTATVEAAVGKAMLASAEQQFLEMLGAMGRARDTSTLRAVGADAQVMAGAVSAALEGFAPDSDEHRQLGDIVALDRALAGLTTIDADHLSDWAGVRSTIVSSAATVSGVDAVMSSAASSAVASVDSVVRVAQQRMRTWRADYELAVRSKRSAVARLSTYQDTMTSQLDRYSELRTSLSDWIDRVEDPSSFVSFSEGYDVLWRAELDRQAVRDAMSGMEVPATMSDVHNELISVVDDGIAAVAAAYQGTVDADYCTTSCHYADTPGWQRFRSESPRITRSYGKAIARWERQKTSAVAAAENRQLPDRPHV